MEILKVRYVHEAVTPWNEVIARVETVNDDPESHELGGIVCDRVYDMGADIHEQSVVERTKVTRLGPIVIRRINLGALPVFQQRPV